MGYVLDCAGVCQNEDFVGDGRKLNVKMGD